MGPRRWHTLLYIPIPGHATLGWELHGFASAVMLASTLFSSDTASCKSVSTVSGVRPVIPLPHPAHGAFNVTAHSGQHCLKPLLCSLVSSEVEANVVCLLSHNLQLVIKITIISLEYIFVMVKLEKSCVCLFGYVYICIYICMYIYIYIYRYISHACGHKLYIRSCMSKLLCGKAHGGHPYTNAFKNDDLHRVNRFSHSHVHLTTRKEPVLFITHCLQLFLEDLVAIHFLSLDLHLELKHGKRSPGIGEFLHFYLTILKSLSLSGTSKHTHMYIYIYIYIYT